MKKKPMTNKEAIHDLMVLATYFMEMSGGSVPECLEYAIQKLSDNDDETLVVERRDK